MPPFNIQDDMKTLAFHILNRAGFGIRLQWPESPGLLLNEDVKRRGDQTVMDGDNLESGQGMKFGEAMLVVVDHLKELFIFPKWVLSEHFSPVLCDRRILIGCRICSFDFAQ